MDEDIITPRKRRRIVVKDDSSDSDTEKMKMDSPKRSSSPGTSEAMECSRTMLAEFNFESPSVKTTNSVKVIILQSNIISILIY